jgi:hypothetical protein
VAQRFNRIQPRVSEMACGTGDFHGRERTPSTAFRLAWAVILWAGLGIYLAIRLLRGLLVVLLVTVPSLFARMFLKGLPLPTVVEYMTTWLPLLLALWLSMRVGRPEHQRNV